MAVFLTWLRIIPTILATVMSIIAALEQGFQEVAGATGNSAAQTGATKLNVVQAALQARYTTEQSVTSRKLLASISGVTLREARGSDLCCGSAGVYNVLENEMALRILASKVEAVNASHAEIVATANPDCLPQLQAGVRVHGSGQKVMHVIEILDRAYQRNSRMPPGR
jgi:Fe-S oxidoreductase